MVHRIPLIVNASASQIQELPTSDTLAGGVPLGAILMWGGGNTIPTGFTLCNAANAGTVNGITVPNLEDKFIIGAKQHSSGWKTNITGSLGASGGSKDAVIVQHRHAPTTSASGTDDSVDGNGNPINQADGRQIAVNDNVVGNYGGGSGTGLGPLGNRHFMENEGVSGSNKNLPPFLALAFIIRTS